MSTALTFILKWFPKETLASAAAQLVVLYVLPKMTPNIAAIMYAFVKEVAKAIPEVVTAATEGAAESTEAAT